jgi:transposase
MEPEVIMGRRRSHSQEFKHEAVQLIVERGVSAAQASRDLGVHANLLRLNVYVQRVKDFGSDPAQAFPGHGRMRPEELENDRLRREVRTTL